MDFTKIKENDVNKPLICAYTQKKIEQLMPLIGFVLILLKHLLLSRFDFHLQNVLNFSPPWNT
jgi:hypothetical protein